MKASQPENKRLLMSLTDQKHKAEVLRNSALNRFITQNKAECKELDKLVKANSALLAVMSIGLMLMAFKGI
jgi:hypothetical protein